jgi:hypothetical protein
VATPKAKSQERNCLQISKESILRAVGDENIMISSLNFRKMKRPKCCLLSLSKMPSLHDILMVIQSNLM